MPGKDRPRARERRRYKRRTAERKASRMCPKCGSAPPAPGRSKCERCLERARLSDRARYAKAEGRLDGRNAETRRRAARARSKRRYEARQAMGTCVKCGLRRPEEGRSRCEPCLGRRNAGDRRQWASRRAAGRCGACGDTAPPGRARCDRCTAMQANRPSRKAYAARSTPGEGPGMRVSTARRPRWGPRAARAARDGVTCAPANIAACPQALPRSTSSRSRRAPPWANGKPSQRPAPPWPSPGSIPTTSPSRPTSR